MAAGNVTNSDVTGLRRDLERLQTENARLSRLLGLRGQDTAPSPEQLSTTAPGLVTMASPVADKLALFADRFAARTDVYAVRWENRRSGMKGWMPAVAGGWRKGMNRHGASYLRLSADVVGSHLVGDVFIGLYPLLVGNTCRFLVADFDGSSAMLDALAYTKAARARSVPASVEISQSGRGAHVWIFFTGASRQFWPERSARPWSRRRWCYAVDGSAVLRPAVSEPGRPSGWRIRESDRRPVARWSSQGRSDVVPRSGHPGAARGSVGIPVDLDRLSPGQAEQIARRAGRTSVGADVTSMSRSSATRVQPPLPAVVNVELSAGLRVDCAQLPSAALATFKHAASMANPKFYELQRLRKSTWDTPRFVRGYDLTLDDHLVLPRGLRHTVAGIVERAGSRLAVTDTRNPGHEIDIAFTADLTTAQSSAVSAMLAHDDASWSRHPAPVRP